MREKETVTGPCWACDCFFIFLQRETIERVGERLCLVGVNSDSVGS